MTIARRCAVRRRRRGRDAVPLMTKRKICYADDDGEKMCYAMQKKRKKWWPLMIAKRLVSAVDDEEGAML